MALPRLPEVSLYLSASRKTCLGQRTGKKGDSMVIKDVVDEVQGFTDSDYMDDKEALSHYVRIGLRNSWYKLCSDGTLNHRWSKEFHRGYRLRHRCTVCCDEEEWLPSYDGCPGYWTRLRPHDTRR